MTEAGLAFRASSDSLINCFSAGVSDSSPRWRPARAISRFFVGNKNNRGAANACCGQMTTRARKLNTSFRPFEKIDLNSAEQLGLTTDCPMSLALGNTDGHGYENSSA